MHGTDYLVIFAVGRKCSRRTDLDAAFVIEQVYHLIDASYVLLVLRFAVRLLFTDRQANVVHYVSVRDLHTYFGDDRIGESRSGSASHERLLS